MLTQSFKPRYSRYNPFPSQNNDFEGHIARMREERDRKAMARLGHEITGAAVAGKLTGKFQIPPYYANQVRAIAIACIEERGKAGAASEICQRLIECGHIRRFDRSQAEAVVWGAIQTSKQKN